MFFWKAYQKLFRESYSRFPISRHQTAVEVFEVLSVAMTSSPEVIWTKIISSILGFQDPLNSVLNSVLSYGLRAFASLGRIDALFLTAHVFWDCALSCVLFHPFWPPAHSWGPSSFILDGPSTFILDGPSTYVFWTTHFRRPSTLTQIRLLLELLTVHFHLDPRPINCFRLLLKRFKFLKIVYFQINDRILLTKFIMIAYFPILIVYS